MYDVVALGESLIDFTPAGINEMGMCLFSRNPGGAPANVLAMLAKLGRKTAFIGKVGADDFGDFLQATMESAAVECSGLLREQKIPTTLAFVQLDEKGNRSFTFYRNPGADVMLRADEVPLSLLKNCRVFHFGSVSLTDEPCRTATLEAAKIAKAAGAMISYDPNYRSFLWSNESIAKKQILYPLPLADLLKVSEEEMSFLTGELDIKTGAQKLSAMGPKVVLVTLGAKGAYCYTPAGEIQLPTYDVKTVDTTGAGDAFLGALLHCILNEKEQNLTQISQQIWKETVDFANAAGSLTTTAMGAIPAMPTIMEIKDCQCKVMQL